MKWVRRAAHPRWLAVLTLAFALVPVWLAMLTYRDAREKDERLVQTSAQVLAEQLQHEFDNYTYFLGSIRTQALRLGDTGLTREQIGPLPDMQFKLPHLLAFGYAGDDQRRILLRWKHGERAPVPAVGDDLAIDAATFTALNARPEGDVFPQSGKLLEGHRFLMLLTVPRLPERNSVRGYVVGWMDIASFCRESKARLVREGVLTVSPAAGDELLPGDRLLKPIQCGSGTWQAAVSRGPRFSQEYGAPAPWLAFLAVALSAVPLVVLAMLAGRSAKLRTALAAEQELLRQQRYFTQSVSHEFRTPLGVILSGTDLLEKYAAHLTPERRAEVLREMRENTRHLSDMVERILLLGRMESGKLACRPAPVNVRTLCGDIVRKTMTAAPGCRIVVTAPDAEALLDAALLGSILDNLLSNAVKYSASGQPVTLTAEATEQHVAFTVRDEGIGIPPEDLPRVCDPFHRCSNVGEVPGTGLGLAIARRCAALHGGALIIESIPDAGTSATVTIPLP